MSNNLIVYIENIIISQHKSEYLVLQILILKLNIIKSFITFSLIYSAAHHVTKQLIEALVLFQIRLVVVLEQLVDVLFPVGRTRAGTVVDHLKVLQLRLQILFPLLIWGVCFSKIKFRFVTLMLKIVVRIGLECVLGLGVCLCEGVLTEIPSDKNSPTNRNNENRQIC